MTRFKICPYCKTKNNPALLECAGCEADISRVRITDEAVEEAVKETAGLSSGEKENEVPMYVRICSDCGYKNAATARQCARCGEFLSDVIPVLDTDTIEEKKAVALLTSVSGDYAFELFGDAVEIGREAGMKEYLSSHGFVSRTHCRFTYEGGVLYVEDAGSTNGTFVNNKPITERTILTDGDEIGIGGCNRNGSRQEQAAYFIVRMNVCTSQGSSTR